MNEQPKPAIGQIWKENDPRIERWVIVQARTGDHRFDRIDPDRSESTRMVLTTRDQLFSGGHSHLVFGVTRRDGYRFVR